MDLRCIVLISFLINLNQTAFPQSAWHALNNGVSNNVYAMFADPVDQSLIFGGREDGIYSSNIFKYKNNSIQPMDIGVYQSGTTDFTRYNDTLFSIGHTFRLNDSIFGISFWNGNHWAPFNKAGKFLQTPYLYQIRSFNNELFVVGEFAHTSDSRIRSLTYYKNGMWNYIGYHLGRIAFPKAMIDFHQILYVGGKIDSLGVTPANNFIAYDGNDWSVPVSNNIGEILNLEVHLDTLYASSSNGGLYYLDSNIWVQKSTTNGWIYEMKSTNEGLVIAGAFTIVNGSIVSAIARINGNIVEDLDGGIDGTVVALELFNNDLFAGGYFTDTTGKGKNNIVRWGLQIGLDEFERENSTLIVAPNPNNGQFRINLGKESSGQIEILDVSGKLQYRSGYKNKQYIDVNYHLEKGIYLLRVTNETGTRSSKLLVTE